MSELWRVSIVCILTSIGYILGMLIGYYISNKIEDKKKDTYKERFIKWHKENKNGK